MSGTGAERPICLYIRDGLEWADEQVVESDMVLTLRQKAELWDQLFTIPYREFRLRMRDISRLNLDAVRGTSLLEWEQIPDGTVVMPADDDDWFRPDAVEVLRSKLSDAGRGYVWPPRWIERASSFGHWRHMMRLRLLPHTKPHWTCSTNAYAVVKGRSDEDHRLLNSHVGASRNFDRSLAAKDGSILSFDETISLTNRSLASQTTLRHRKLSIRRSTLLRKYRSYQTLYDEPMREELAWAQPYVDMMRELTSELKLRNGADR